LAAVAAVAAQVVTQILIRLAPVLISLLVVLAAVAVRVLILAMVVLVVCQWMIRGSFASLRESSTVTLERLARYLQRVRVARESLPQQTRQ
jgi:hypothetical protein